MRKMCSARAQHTPKRILVLLVMLAVLFPLGAAALAPQATAGFGRVADPSTINSWTPYFGSGVLDTAQVGRIWTDKTVADGDISLEGSGVVVSRQNTDNFLVGLSAISSFKNIMGQTGAPLDVVLVLDISSSMRTSANAGAITDMVEAANVTIDSLYQLNAANRVGVVFFDRTAYLSMPLDTYSPTGPPATLNPGGTYLSVASVDESLIDIHADGPVAGNLNSQVQAIEGTYTQGGLLAARQAFEDAPNKTGRTPFLILMSDGSPTISFPDYMIAPLDSVNQAPGAPKGAMKNGQGTTGIAFVTQTTAAYVHAFMEGEYNTKALFYTLGFGLENLSGSTGVLAHAVLDPAYNTPEMDAYWATFNNLSPPTAMDVWSTNLTGPAYQLERGNDGLASYAGSPYGIPYVDEYYAAESRQELLQVFADIVDEIELQASSYPTMTAGDNADMSGYVHFEDIIGEYMQVKRVNGLAYSGAFYTGAQFAREMMQSYQEYLAAGGPEENPGGDPGGGENPGTGPAYSNQMYEFIKSSAIRLGTTIENTLQLAVNAVQQGQIYYSSTADFSNFAAWYGNDADIYLGPADMAASSPPAGATMLNQSYVFFREDAAANTGPDLMYIGVRVKTSLATGRQTVVFTIPASMVPVVQYNIRLDGTNDVEQAANAEITMAGAYPVSVFYEVGLLEGITEETVAAMVAPGYAYLSGGTYTFYTNEWAPDNAHTDALFTPSVQNEFYFFYRDTPVYVSDGSGGYIPLSTSPTPGETYFYKAQLYDISSGTVAQQYRALPDNAAIVPGGPGEFYVPQGTPKLGEFSYVLPKTPGNYTATYPNARVLTPFYNTTGDVWMVAANLGNNGLLRLRPSAPSPQTGDASALWAWALAASLALVLGGLCLHIMAAQGRKTR